MPELSRELAAAPVAWEDLLRMSLDAAPCGIALFDTDMRYLASSRTYRESLGIADERLLGRSHYEIFPEIPQRWRDVHRRCLAGATERADEDVFVRADGRIGYWQWEIRPWHLADGSIGGIVMFNRDVTEAMERQCELRRLSDGLDKAGFGIAIVNAQTNAITYANPAFAAQHAPPGSDMIGRSVLDTYAPAEHERVRHLLDEADSKGHAVFESERLRGDGTLFPALTAITAVQHAASSPSYRVCTVLDITERKQADAALREKDARFRSYIDSAPLSVTVVNADGAIVAANPAAETMLRCGAADLLGRHFTDLHFAGEQAAARADWNRLKQDGQLQREYLIRRSDGTGFWALLSAVALSDGSALGFLQDISPLKQAEAARRAAEDDLFALVQLGPGVLYRADVTPGRIRLLSVLGDIRRIASSAGPDEDSGALVASILRYPAIGAAMHRMANAGGPPSSATDVLIAGLGGSERWLRNSARVIERKAASTEIAGYLSDVTAEIDEQRRIQRVATLITLGEMATGMAHELNQPLSSINFAAQNATLQLQRPAPDLLMVGNKLEKIAAETLRASKLLDHLKIFARNEKRAMEPFSWQVALHNAMELMAPRLRTASVQDAVPQDLPPVLGVPILMEQILINLIGNAIDAYETRAAPADPAVRIVTVSGAMEDATVVLRVADRAGGIPSAVLERVFEPFFTTKSPGKGTGLGLALCFGTVSGMGGTLTARNHNGGAVFEIRLPPAAAMAQDEPSSGAQV